MQASEGRDSFILSVGTPAVQHATPAGLRRPTKPGNNGDRSTCITGRNAAQRGFHPTRKPSTDWSKVSPAVPSCTRISTGMKPPLGGDSSKSVCGDGDGDGSPELLGRACVRACVRACGSDSPLALHLHLAGARVLCRQHLCLDKLVFFQLAHLHPPSRSSAALGDCTVPPLH